MKLKLPFKKGENEILKFDLMFYLYVSHLEQVFNTAENTKMGKIIFRIAGFSEYVKSK